ncbi:S8 family serine peptidase [Paraglaciecola sp. 2405UD69-4]|uniref:S8 family serine peptidase n=1 Tax=Paraglaciecola sp. 2405UD69-4 TaxID=3391836 RepID=UPI0039C913C3
MKIKPIVAGVSTAIVLMGGISLNTIAAEQLPTEKKLETLKAVKVEKQLKSTSRNTRQVFTKQEGVTGKQKYIVRFEEDSLVAHMAKLKGGKRSASKLNSKSRDSKAYLKRLKNKQEGMEKKIKGKLSRSLNVKRRYQAAINGIAMEMTQEEAQEVAKLAGVTKIEVDREDTIQTDRGPTYIGAPELWAGATNLEAKGEGIVIGILDSGINGDHPSFAAVGSDDYEHVNPLGEGVYLGECDPGSDDYNALSVCNSKLIGRYLFIDATPTEDSSEDTDGHGSHVASTAGGNFLSAPVLDAEGNESGLNIEISGVAPHANIIAFQVCAPSCFASDRVAAVEQAILDGQVDVLNHSIGSSTPVTIDPWTDSVDLAFLAAREAGITVVNSIGNNGPDPSSLGSSGAPWLSNVANFTHDREIAPKFIDGFTGGDTEGPSVLEGAGITAGLDSAPIVYAANYDNGDAEPEQCLVPFPEGTWTNGEIVVCDRGTIARVDKCINVRDGGAAGCVLTNIDDGATGVSNDAHVIPAIHVEADAGNQIKAWLSTGSGHTASISDSLQPFGSNPELGSIASSSTSRGPHLGQDYLPVTFGAPGTDIYAALADGTEYGFLSGTSMASPHVAGATALLKQVQPEWTDAEILSALATTSDSQAFKEDGVTAADPFDMGAGIIRVDLAAEAGLLMDESIANFENADPSLGGDPTNLNVPGLVTRTCVITCTWTRTFTATTDGSWSVSTTDSTIVASPESFDLNEGESQSVVITVDSTEFENGTWVHGQIDFTPAGDLPDQHLTVSFVPSTGELPDEVNISATRDQDSYLLTGLEAAEISDLQISVSGLATPSTTEISVAGDSDNSTPYDNLSDGVYYSLIDVSSSVSRIVATTSDATSTAPDIDVRIGYDSNGNGLPDESEELCISATATAEESCSITSPQSGEWWVMVQNWGPSNAEQDTVVLSTTLVDADESNLVVTGPSVVSELTPFDLRLNYDLTGSVQEDVYYGVVTLGSDSEMTDNIGSIPVTITRVADDVSYAVSSDSAVAGDVLTFSVEVAANNTPEDRNYNIAANIPDGYTLVSGSITGDGELADGLITWNLSQPSSLNATPAYSITTSNDSASCAAPFANSGAYVDLEQFGILPNAGIEGDTVTYSAFSGQNFNFFGNTFTGGFNFTDDGFIFFDGTTAGTTPWVNLPIPDSSDPNNLIAVLWRDFVIPAANTTPGSVVGVSLATAGSDLTIIEYDNMKLYPGTGQDSIDFQMSITGFVDDTPGAYEIVMAFDNVETSETTGTIGLEDATGTTGVQYTFNGVNVTDGMAICYDLQSVSVESKTLSYQVTVDNDASGSITSELSNSVDSIGSVEVTESVTVAIESAEVTGDWDADGDVDTDDIKGLFSAILSRQDIDLAFDLNGDSLVNSTDVRVLQTLCTRDFCATN